MSFASVNSAVHAWLSGNVAGLTTLYPAVPYWMLGDQWQANSVPGTPAYLHITDMTESRITVPALPRAGGQKQRDYQFLLVMLYQYLIPPGSTTDRSDWVNGQLALLDAAVARLEADPSMGGTVFEAANQHDGIKTHRDGPVLDATGGKLMAWCHVEFTVTEIVQA